MVARFHKLYETFRLLSFGSSLPYNRMIYVSQHPQMCHGLGKQNEVFKAMVQTQDSLWAWMLTSTSYSWPSSSSLSSSSMSAPSRWGRWMGSGAGLAPTRWGRSGAGSSWLSRAPAPAGTHGRAPPGPNGAPAPASRSIRTR